MRIGIISDTPSLLRPAAIKQLAGADHIIRAGDIGAPEVIEGLRRIAPDHSRCPGFEVTDAIGRLAPSSPR